MIMNFESLEKSTYGYKAAVIKELSEDDRFSALVPRTIYISDMVFYKFLLEDSEIYEKVRSWFKASESDTGEEADEVFDELHKLLQERYVPFLKKEMSGLEKRIIEEIGIGKKVIVRSSGLEDIADTVNAGGNRSIPDVEPEDIYEAISEVVISYFSPKVLSVLHSTTSAEISNPYKFRCPVFIQELVGSTSTELNTEMYPVVAPEVLEEIAGKVLALKSKFGRDIDSEWVIKEGDTAVSVVAFSREPAFGAECVYMLCSLGMGSAVRRTAIVNATHYLIPCHDGEADCKFFIEYPERKTVPYELSAIDCTQWLVQCRPAVPISIDIQINETMQRDPVLDPGITFPFKSIVVGKGDVDGRFIISESVSEAWEEYIHDSGKSGYVGCIVRHGAALEHAGIMFTEQQIPVIAVSDEVFAALATKHDRRFAVCLGLGVFSEVTDGTSFEYNKGINQGVPLQMEGAKVRTHLDPVIVDEGFSKRSEGALVLWNTVNKIKALSEDLLTNGAINVAVHQQIQELCSPYFELSNSPLGKGILLYSTFLETLASQAADIRTFMLWYRLLLLFIHSKMLYVFSQTDTTIDKSVISIIYDQISQGSLADKLEFINACGGSLGTIDGHDYKAEILYSISKDDATKLPVDLKAEYEAYHRFLEEYDLTDFSYSDVDNLYQKYCDRAPQEMGRLILASLLRERKSIALACLYLQMVSLKTTIGGTQIQTTVDSFLMSEECGNIDQRVLTTQVVLSYGGLGDLELLLEHKESAHEFVALLSSLHLGLLCPTLDRIFFNHRCGVLDQKPTELTCVRKRLIEDLSALGSYAVQNKDNLYPVLSNIITNLTSTVIDLFDIEGKSYANSLALDIHGVYSTYVTHLEQWNEFLRKKLVSPDIEYHEVPEIMEGKIRSLREKRNDHIAIGVDNEWYEKIYMEMDFNPHEIQNILHQSSIYFADKKNQFYPSAYVEKIHQSLITFGLTNRRLLKNQNDCIEVETGLGNFKTHKSSILIRADSISAVYTEAPLISMGRIIVLNHIFDSLAIVYPQYNIVARLQERNEDHLLYIYMSSNKGNYSFEELSLGVNIICSMFDAVELGGGTANRTADFFVKEFCSLKTFTFFLERMVDYHSRLTYSDDMGGGMEDNDVCIYQSLIALMVMFPERYHVFKDASGFDATLKVILEDLNKPEWKTDRYELREGWLESTYCICLAIMYPTELRRALSEDGTQLPDPELCDLYLRIANS